MSGDRLPDILSRTVLIYRTFRATDSPRTDAPIQMFYADRLLSKCKTSRYRELHARRRDAGCQQSMKRPRHGETPRGPRAARPQFSVVFRTHASARLRTMASRRLVHYIAAVQVTHDHSFQEQSLKAERTWRLGVERVWQKMGLSKRETPDGGSRNKTLDVVSDCQICRHILTLQHSPRDRGCFCPTPSQHATRWPRAL